MSPAQPCPRSSRWLIHSLGGREHAGPCYMVIMAHEDLSWGGLINENPLSKPRALVPNGKLLHPQSLILNFILLDGCRHRPGGSLSCDWWVF